MPSMIAYPMPRTLRAAASLLAALLCIMAWEASAQVEDLPPRDVYIERGRTRGDQITFCVNPAAMMASFDSALARELAARLLLTPTIIEVKTWHPTEPLDYRIPLGYDELYIEFAERCDGFMGFTLAQGYPSWLIVTRAYLTTRTVLATITPQYHRLADIPMNRPIGTRMLGGADNQLLVYLQSLPEKSRWPRAPYLNNKILIDRLADQTVAAAFVWEPALFRATDGALEPAGFRIIAAPFESSETEFGIALRSKDRYLSTTLGQAIEALRADGTIDTLLVDHGLAPRPKQRPKN
jgi:polar amino acid transport system substrate-binding protein